MPMEARSAVPITQDIRGARYQGDCSEVRAATATLDRSVVQSCEYSRQGILSPYRDIMIVPRRLVDALLATASDAIIATDRTGIIDFWNPGAVRIFGFTADEAVGRSLDLIIPDNLAGQGWPTHFSRIYDRHAEGRAGSSDRDSGDSSRRDQAIRRKP
jgi:PAS domain-containing protein